MISTLSMQIYAVSITIRIVVIVQDIKYDGTMMIIW